MKCPHCGKNISLFNRGVQLNDGFICRTCFQGLGFDLKSDVSATKCAYTYSAIKDGKNALIEREKAKRDAHYDFLVHWDDDKIWDILERYQKQNTDREYKYEGYTMRELKESGLYGEKIYKYPPLDVSVELKEKDDNIDVYLFDGDKDVLIGHPPKTKVKKIKTLTKELENYFIHATLSGGDYWKLKDNGYVEDDWSDDLKVKVSIDWSAFL